MVQSLDEQIVECELLPIRDINQAKDVAVFLRKAYSDHLTRFIDCHINGNGDFSWPLTAEFDIHMAVTTILRSAESGYLPIHIVLRKY